MPAAQEQRRSRYRRRGGEHQRGVSRTARAAIVTPIVALLAAAGAATGSVADASASSPIEGVWSFNGGQIAVLTGSNGTFEGKVVAETKFAQCTHPVNQQIWSEMTLQPDGSYFGKHQWYFESTSCPLNPTLGPTAWRVLEGPGGVRFLRVCLSAPGGPQPVIATDGSSSGVTYGCVDSARISPLPASQVLGLQQVASLPSAKRCLSRRSFAVHVRDPAHDPFRSISISISGRRLSVRHRGSFSIAQVDLKGSPKGTFVLAIHGTTVLGRRLSGKRVYHTCVRRASRHHGGR